MTPTFFNSMMTEGIERVEVLKGPSAFLNGAGPGGSVGGVINIIPKRAGETPITQFTPTYASNAQFGGHVDVGRRFGDNNQFGLRVNAAYRNGNTPIDNQTLEARLFTLGFDFRGDGVRGSADFGYQYQNLTAARRFPRTAFGVPVLSAPNNTTNFNYPWEFNANEVFYGAVRGEVDIVDNLTAFLSVGGSQRKQQNVGTDRVITNTMGTLAPTTASIAADRMYGASMETGVRATFETGPIHHQATIAYNRAWREWRRGNFNFNFPVPISNLYVPGWASAPNPAFIPTPDGAPKRSEFDLSSVVDRRHAVGLAGARAAHARRARQQIKAWNFNTDDGRGHVVLQRGGGDADGRPGREALAERVGVRQLHPGTAGGPDGPDRNAQRRPGLRAVHHQPVRGWRQGRLGQAHDDAGCFPDLPAQLVHHAEAATCSSSTASSAIAASSSTCSAR